MNIMSLKLNACIISIISNGDMADPRTNEVWMIHFRATCEITFGNSSTKNMLSFWRQLSDAEERGCFAIYIWIPVS
jgi:hypothetical protein